MNLKFCLFNITKKNYFAWIFCQISTSILHFLLFFLPNILLTKLFAYIGKICKEICRWRRHFSEHLLYIQEKFKQISCWIITVSTVLHSVYRYCITQYRIYQCCRFRLLYFTNLITVTVNVFDIFYYCYLQHILSKQQSLQCVLYTWIIIVSDIQLRVGHPFFSKECSVLCILLRSL